MLVLTHDCVLKHSDLKLIKSHEKLQVVRFSKGLEGINYADGAHTTGEKKLIVLITITFVELFIIITNRIFILTKIQLFEEVKTFITSN